MRTVTRLGLALGLFPALASLAIAQEPETPIADSSAAQSLQYQTGNIELPNKIATLHLGGDYRYLNPAETEKMLVMWGNPPGNDTQGAIVPNGVDPLTQEGWAVILTYVDDGHVDDSEAADIDYDDLLEDLKEGTEQGNEERKQAGYKPIHLVGWAEKPHYDSAAKKLYWAKELRRDGSAASGLNYDVRVLGREGVLSMNAVAGMDQLPQVRSDMRALIEVAEFNQGQRYADFNSKTDRTAEYGLATLIAAGVGAKLGLFAKIGAWLLAFKKFVIMAVVAIGAFVGKLFGRKKDATT